MKKSSPAELRKLRVRARELEAQEQSGQDEKFEKKLGVYETPERKKLKVWVTWFLAFAFVITSAGFIMGSRATKANNERQEQQQKDKGRPDTQEEKNQKELQANLEYFTKQVADDPKNTQSLCNLAATYFELGNNTSAIENYKKALEIDPKDSYAMQHLADVYVKDKKYKEAKELMEKAVAVCDKADQHAYYAKMALLDFHDKNNDGAIDNMKKAVALEAKPEYYANLAEFYEAKGNNEEAIKAIESGVEIAKAMGDERSLAIMDLLKEKMKKAIIEPNTDKSKAPAPGTNQPKPAAPGNVKTENPGQPQAPQGQAPVQPGQPQANQPGANPPAENAPAQPAPAGNAPVNPPAAPQGNNQAPAAPPAAPAPGNN